MQDSMALHNTLMQSNETLSMTNNKNPNLLETIKAALRLVSYETDIVTESNILGIYEPLYPKTNKWIRYTFYNESIHTTIFTEPNSTKLEDIYISDNIEQFEPTKLQSDLNSLNIEYLNYHFKPSDTNDSLYDADFTYKSKDYQHANITFSAINLTQNEIETYNKLKSLPKGIINIRVYSTQKDAN
ncbi:hypothetical protein CIK80_12205 [Psychrobacter sp. JB193]|nr:hypothetical protein CIK80_12205 [Psychrobacter sp. JB193]